MATRLTLRDELERRVGDPSNVVWTETDLNGYIEQAIKSLYPSFYLRKVGTTTAGAGPLQTKPTGAKNLYYIGHQRAGSTRARPLRRWTEGDTDAVVDKSGITGDTLIWAWTIGFTYVADDTTTFDIPQEAEEIVVLRALISCYENVLQERSKTEKFYALNIREGSTEQDILGILDTLHISVNQRLQNAWPLPTRIPAPQA